MTDASEPDVDELVEDDVDGDLEAEGDGWLVSPVPFSPPGAAPTFDEQRSLWLRLADRRWRVRGLERNTSFDVLRVQVVKGGVDGGSMAARCRRISLIAHTAALRSPSLGKLSPASGMGPLGREFRQWDGAILSPVVGLYACAWGERRERIRGGRGRSGQVMPPVWSRTRRR